MEHMASELWSRWSCGGCDSCTSLPTKENLQEFERHILEEENQRDRLHGRRWRDHRSKRLRHE